MSSDSTTIEAFVLGAAAIGGIDNFTTELPRVVLEAFFFGLYTVLAAIGLGVLARTRPRSLRTWAAVIACEGMYALAVAHLAIDLKRLTIDVGRSRNLQNVAALCLTALAIDAPDEICASGGEAGLTQLLEPAGTGREWVPITLLVVNILLSSGILLWRGWVRSVRKRLVGVVSVVLILAAIPLYIICIVINDNLEDGFSTGTLFLTWVTMLWITMLMCKDMWRRRLEIARSMHGLSFNARLGKLTHLIVNSGVPYVLFWTVIAAWCIVIWSDSSTSGAGEFIHAIRALIASAFIDIVGMYTTLVLMLAALRDMMPAKRVSKTPNVHPLARVRLSADSAATVQATDLPVDILKTAFMHEDEGHVYGDVKSGGLV
ncbi:uncharacterized protein PHACADRAFT_250995 [Phanerochaete carnosa HHB-10118-sp]|uniref:Uncharacterized protein n=1 Tax=Phanerochaete carnosa (strain HHB-10118-sp) TaxID=650164 RepID=K5VB42_PHACS|nr:uncharacterized protein PHACADRAFT_250995 [Phanerochaete carnosa HHB-10118-sp]EKM60106.1 hypothetical protein PHACADRAFT_250995 [Phanerochaete carnosa HHB-10118-sp]